MPEMLARYEFKYLIRSDQIPIIRARAATFCDPDPYGRDGVYSVNSLYFDDTDWKLARQTLEGVRNRFKLRMRTYGFEPTDPVFCEIKARVGTSIVKSRALVDRSFATGIARGDPPGPGGCTALKKGHQPDLDRYRNLMDRLDLRPRVWVRYQREAYGSAYGDNARLTFDTSLQTQLPAEDRAYTADPDRWRPVPLEGPQDILEMKFNGAFPAWMLRLVHELQLHRQSVSKYVSSVLTAGMLPWATPERGDQWIAS